MVGEQEKKKRSSIILLLFGCLFLPALGYAAPPLSVYGNLPGFEMASLSLSGNRIAIIGVVNDERRLIVLDKDNKPIRVAGLGDTKVRGLYWAGDDIVLVYKSDTRNLGMDFTSDKAELFSMIVVPLDAGKPWSVLRTVSNLLPVA